MMFGWSHLNPIPVYDGGRSPPIVGRATAGGGSSSFLSPSGILFPFEHDSASASRLIDASAQSFATINAQAKDQCHGNLTRKHGKARCHV